MFGTFGKLLLFISVAVLLLACGDGENPGSTQQQQRKPYAPYAPLATLDIEAADVAHAQGLLAVTGYGEVSLWDTSDLTSPKKVGVISGYSPTSGTEVARDSFGSVYISGSLLTVSVQPACLGFCTADQGYIALYDVARPDQPTRLATIPDGAERLLIDGNFLYILRRSVPAPTSQLQIVDISKPAAPQVVATQDVASAFSLEKQSGRIYLPFSDFSARTYGMQIVDVSDPRAPSILSTSGTPVADAGKAFAALLPTQAYWTNGSQRIGSLTVGTWQMGADTAVPFVAKGIAAAADGNLLVAAGAQGVQVYSVQSDASLTLSRTMQTPYPAGWLKVFQTTGVVMTEQVRDCSSSSGGCSVLASSKVVLFSTSP